ncbi:MAG TPA: YbdK family carboxylate-amine ligase [Longimicrobiales bacterium]
MKRSGDAALRQQYTVGVEEEYQLVSPETGELRSHGRAVRDADQTGAVGGEVKDTMLEIGTPVCRDAAELAARIGERRFQASAAAASEDLEILAAGVHPFSRPDVAGITQESRPLMLIALFREALRQHSIWGMHVHVAVPPHRDRVTLMNTVRSFGPHLLALSCSSPFHLGVDTGYASFRTLVWRGFPFVGVPPRFESAAEYRAYVDLLLQVGTIPDERTLYWSVRPSARYPTLELRMCDACPRLDEAVSIAALARAVVAGSAEGLIEPIGSSLGTSLQDEILRENEWIAARDGLDATLIAPERPGRGVPVRDAIGELLEAIRPVAERLGDADQVAAVRTIVERGNAADRMRRRRAGGDSMQAIAAWLVAETRAGTGIDRRARHRETSARSVPASNG